MSIPYRPEIDGLRTIAVTSVLIYHLKLVTASGVILSGGFLGVDIFFVISGFLITSILLREFSQTGRISILNFYERRARRLLPALFVVIFASIPVAWALLMPSEMIRFVQSLGASLLFVSNMFWWGASQEYGAASGLLQPFLHTWSLAVEEQYYLLFPLVFVFLLRLARPRTIIGVLIAGIVFGGIFAHVFTGMNPGLSFYWLISRIWEILAGSLVAYLLFQTPNFGAKIKGRQWLPVLGLGLLAVPMWRMDIAWFHPGLGTLSSVLGTALILLYCRPGDAVTRLLSLRPVVFIGLISYSLYLWHYPIFAFGRIISHEPQLWEKSIWMGLSFAFATLSYRYVEGPYRRRETVSIKGLVIHMGAAFSLVLAFCVTMWATDGMRERLQGMIALYGENEFDNVILRERSWEPLAILAAAHGLGKSEASRPSAFEKTGWFDPASTYTKVLVLGDSHSKDIFNAFHLNPDLFEGYLFARFGARASSLPTDLQALRNSPNYQQADIVVLSFRYSLQAVAQIPKLVKALREDGKDIRLTSLTVELPTQNGHPFFDALWRASNGDISAQELARQAYVNQQPHVEQVNAALAEVAAELDLVLYYKQELICNDSAQTCDVLTPDGKKAFYDTNHFTLEGARHFGRKIAELNWLGAGQ